MQHTVIIGNGIAGVTLARELRKQVDDPITIISGESEYFFSRTALMYEYMGHMPWKMLQPYENWFWAKNKLDLKHAWVEKVDFQAKTLHLQGGETLSYDRLVLATGSKPNKFGWPGQDLPGVQGLYSKQDLESLHANTLDAKGKKNVERAVIVGGGLIGIEMAEMLLTRGIAVTMLVREPFYWSNVLPEEESKMVGRHMTGEHHIDLRLSSNLDSIEAGPDGRAAAITVKETGERIECQVVGLTAGVSPNVDFLKGTELEIERGIMVDHYFNTNLPDVYAIGDCVQFREAAPGRRPMEQVWYTGRMHAETLAYNLTQGKAPYRPGPWFNSAKFFDIEYQTYGWVSAKPQEHEQHLYWEHPDGKKALRVIYDKNTLELIAINLMGIRFRHEVCDAWLKAKTPIAEVLADLHLANFDPEFFKDYERYIIAQYNALNPVAKVKSKKKKKLLGIF